MEENDFRHQYTPPASTTLLVEDSDDDSYLGEPKSVPAGHALKWIGDTWQLFKQQPGLWILSFVIYLAINLVLAVIPFIGGLAQVFMAFILQAGFIYAGEKVRSEGAFELGDIFAGFQINLKSLLLLGALYLVLMVAVFVLFFMFGGSSALLMAAANAEQETRALASAGAGIGVGSILMLLIASILIIIGFFLPTVLIVLENEPVIQAIKLSLQAFGRNVLGAVLCAILTGLLCLVAAIPFGLGLLVVGPMMMLLSFCVYRDLFYTEA